MIGLSVAVAIRIMQRDVMWLMKRQGLEVNLKEVEVQAEADTNSSCHLTRLAA